ncbi:TetR/AcrR family transcriptional regulator [Rhodococcus sp. YH3-3]|uniref:TetR/AcrR family transcriptional regulator n=1 Tax=Rhodococcus sp. YH3-3 TaxID=1803579 RepID=UPI0007DB40DF|nr:TetR/AcrR family transcriptional regulator [Rhodococcus sp. YH3-3]
MARNPTSKTVPRDEGPSDSKSARTRTRILDAAAHILSIKGYSGTRLTDVADHAELQAPAIYYYFPSREDLIEEVMWVGIADMREHLRSTLDKVDSDKTPMDRIMIAVEAHLRHELEISDYTTASIRNAGQLPENMRERQKAEEAKYGEIWRKLFKDALDEGEIRPDIDIRVARMLVMGALNWAAEWWNPRRGSLDVVVQTAQSIVRAGIGPIAEDALAAPPVVMPKRRAPARRSRAAAQDS